MASSKACMSMPSTAAGPGWPTWFQTKSSPLKRWTASQTIRRESSSLVRSATIPWAVPPAAVISPTTGLHPRGRDVDHGDLRAFAGEAKGPGPSHAGARGGDDSDLSSQAHGGPPKSRLRRYLTRCPRDDRSGHLLAAVDIEDGPGDEGRGVGGKKENGLGDLLRLAQPA